MKKRYSEELGDWIKKRASTKRDKNLVMFLAVKDDVADALQAGYPVKTIWEHMYATGRLSIGYDSFLNYTNRQLRKPTNKPSSEKLRIKDKATSEPVSNEKSSSTVKTEPGKSKGFFINSSPNKEDLV